MYIHFIMTHIFLLLFQFRSIQKYFCFLRVAIPESVRYNEHIFKIGLIKVEQYRIPALRSTASVRRRGSVFTDKEILMEKKTLSRDAVIIRTSIFGILANVLLAAFKAGVGLLAHSIAMTLDAVNNLSDAISSVVTIAGTKLAGRKPDKKHPLGHGRIEYLGTMIVAAIVLYAGITALIESVKKIIEPEDVNHTWVTLVVLAAAIAVKMILGTYFKRVGKKVNSGSLTASGTDALFDAILSGSVLLSAVIYLWTGFNLEAYVGVLISVFILKAGVEMMLETVNELLGKREDREFLADIRRTVCEDENVRGAYDLILHSYGPERYIGSVHVEVCDTMTADEIDLMERRIADNVYQKHGVLLAGIGIYAHNTKDDQVAALRLAVTHIVNAHEGVLQIHGFYADVEKRAIGFDVILDFALADRQAVFEQIQKDVQAAYPDYTIRMTMDIDF